MIYMFRPLLGHLSAENRYKRCIKYLCIGYIHVVRKIILKLILKECDGKTWTGLSWLRIGTGDGRL